MFEEIVEIRTEKEINIAVKLAETLKESEHLNRIMILNSDLSDFTKNFLLYDFNETGTQEEIASKISKSNKLYFNYALRPKWTLQTFLFNNFESRPPNDILKKLNIFTFYNYYTDSIRDSINDNFQIFIAKPEVTSIIDSVNISIYNKLSVDINNIKIKNFMMQLFLIKYNTESEYNLESTVPFSFVKIFLDDKSYSDFENKFSIIKDISDSSELSLKDIIKVLTDKYNVSEIPRMSDVSDEVTAEIIEKTELEEDKIEFKSSEETEAIKISKPEKIEITKKTETINIYSEELIKEEKARDKNLSQGILSDSIIESKKKVNENKETIDATNTTDKNEISVLFDEIQSDKILNKVYKNDLLLKDISFIKLNKFKSWKEASDHLREIFKNNRVDLYNKVVINFVNTLNDYFKNK